ncbi:MAG: SDR family oxidoreductase [Pseudomonadota bacterium]
MKLIVTGGASGVGRALLSMLSAHEVWVLDRNRPEDLGSGHHYVPLDLADERAIEAALQALPGQIDGLANVAGIAQARQPEQVLAVNFFGMRRLSEALEPKLRGGAIVNVSSIAGRDWQAKLARLEPLLSSTSFEQDLRWCAEHREQFARDPYTLSKRLVTAYTLRSAQRALKAGFRINCISPGPIETPLYPTFESIMGKAQSDWTAAQTGRIATPEDIAEVLALLLTGPCSWLNGVDVPVDGGYCAGLDAGWIDFSASPVMRALAARKNKGG